MMKVVKFRDLSMNEIQVSFSGGGDIRVYCSAKEEPEKIISCLLLNKHQALILISAINDLLETDD